MSYVNTGEETGSKNVGNGLRVRSGVCPWEVRKELRRGPSEGEGSLQWRP